ncbi:ImmA/IrrE family metallo-endopeptidase [Brevibacillus dissolubilis]|uniref:ImmA/IrrE family metallo-endopeptidase n=1 Tax=Brevibacillus dissolubilis TaxID=1844116 RepID=UPI00159BCE45|nr:ImmA/IrrE family metallo-endopeptidase [Brevibacillus dissolubilis]
MDLSFYKMTSLEEWITKHYITHGILTPQDMEIERICASFGGEVSYTRMQSHAIWMDDGTNDFLVMLNRNLSESDRRTEFFHELCHPLRHGSNQLQSSCSMRNLQEGQASSFQLYASIPFFMVQKLSLPRYEQDLIELLAHEFNVTPELASRRFDQIKRRIWQEQLHQLFISYIHKQKRKQPKHQAAASNQ